MQVILARLVHKGKARFVMPDDLRKGMVINLMQIFLDVVTVTARDFEIEAKLKRRGHDRLVFGPSVIPTAFVHMVKGRGEHKARPVVLKAFVNVQLSA